MSKNVINQHPWWHKIFEYWYKTIEYRDGLLGNLTPDMDCIYYKCSWPGCKWRREKTVINKKESKL